MQTSRYRQNRNKRSNEGIDRRLDQFLETGRQVVDGVAGARPGKRRSSNSSRNKGSHLDNVGRWVGDKLDWLLEDEDDWIEPWQEEHKENLPVQKRPLDAISLRVPQRIQASKIDEKSSEVLDDWPDESSFRVDRWKRELERKPQDRLQKSNNERHSQSFKPSSRPLPRSSRRRNQPAD